MISCACVVHGFVARASCALFYLFSIVFGSLVVLGASFFVRSTVVVFMHCIGSPVRMQSVSSSSITVSR